MVPVSACDRSCSLSRVWTSGDKRSRDFIPRTGREDSGGGTVWIVLGSPEGWMSSTTTYTKRHRQKNRTENDKSIANTNATVEDHEPNSGVPSPPRKRGRPHSEASKNIDEPRKKSKSLHKLLVCAFIVVFTMTYEC